MQLSFTIPVRRISAKDSFFFKLSVREERWWVFDRLLVRLLQRIHLGSWDEGDQMTESGLW